MGTPESKWERPHHTSSVEAIPESKKNGRPPTAGSTKKAHNKFVQSQKAK